MKLSEIVILRETAVPTESTNDKYQVYEMSTPGGDQAYYGYIKFDIEAPQPRGNRSVDERLRRAILAQSRKGTNEEYNSRGSKSLVDAAGGEDNVRIDIKEFQVPSEFDAFVLRNDYRASESTSITRPTNMPRTMYDRAKLEHPDKIIKWGLEGGKKVKTPADMTANEAMIAGLFTLQDLMMASGGKPSVKAQISQDLKTMMYLPFKAKWLTQMA